jgi:hypothetical protein
MWKQLVDASIPIYNQAPAESFALKNDAIGGAIAVANHYAEYNIGSGNTTIIRNDIPEIVDIYTYYLLNLYQEIYKIKIAENFDFTFPDTVNPYSIWFQDNWILLCQPSGNQLTANIEISFKDVLGIKINGFYKIEELPANFVATKVEIDSTIIPVTNNQFTSDYLYPANTEIEIIGNLSIDNYPCWGRVVAIKVEGISSVEQMNFMGMSFSLAENPYVPKQGEFIFDAAKETLFLFVPYYKSLGLITKPSIDSAAKGQYISRISNQ